MIQGKCCNLLLLSFLISKTQQFLPLYQQFSLLGIFLFQRNPWLTQSHPLRLSSNFISMMPTPPPDLNFQPSLSHPHPPNASYSIFLITPAPSTWDILTCKVLYLLYLLLVVIFLLLESSYGVKIFIYYVSQVSRTVPST